VITWCMYDAGAG